MTTDTEREQLLLDISSETRSLELLVSYTAGFDCMRVVDHIEFFLFLLSSSACGGVIGPEFAKWESTFITPLTPDEVVIDLAVVSSS